ncbi:TPA: ATP-binding protein, partial [Escherichia coli]|nr:ATP-binding protein [Escherichia coli]
FNVNSIPLTQLKNSWNEEKQLDIWSNIEDNVEPRIAGDEGVYPMSSGQLSYFKFALLACLYIENGSFVLLDEPETHLHPKLISDFVTLLDNILERTGSFAIIATHSVYFVREVTREQVHVFKRDANKLIHILSPRLK